MLNFLFHSSGILSAQSNVNTCFISLQDPMNLTNADNAFTLYYVKFRAAAPKVRVSIYLFLLLPEITHQQFLDKKKIRFFFSIFFSFSH